MKRILLVILMIILGSSFASAQAVAVKKETTFERASKYYFQRKLEMAELLLQEELKNNPENQKAYSYLGDVFLVKKRYDGALKLFQKSINLNPQAAEDYFRIGQIYYYKGLGDLAIENFLKAVKIKQTLNISYYHAGLSALMLNRHKNDCIKYWLIFLEEAPEDPQHEKIRRVVEMLQDPNFVLPPVGSDIPIEEALHLGGAVLQESKPELQDQKAGQEQKKTINTYEDIYLDDDL